MKAILIKSVVLVTLLFSGILSANLNAETKYITNDGVKGELVVSKTIYRHDGYLYRHLKYNYTYDEQSRLIGKEAFKWDSKNEKWDPYYKLDYNYIAYQVVVEYAKWNEKEHAYNLSKEKSIYEKNELNAPVAYTNYEWNDNKSSWIITENMTYYQIDVLLAYIR